MSKWNDVFNAQQPIEKIKEALRLLESSNTEKLTPDDLASYSRLLKAVKIILAHLENLDPELYNQNVWGSIGTWTTNIQNYANAFSQGPSTSGLTNANSMADEILGVLRPSGALPPIEIVRAVTDSAKSFQATIIAELDNIRKTVAEEKTVIATITKAVDVERTRLDGFAPIIEQQKARLDLAIAAFQQQSTTTEAGRATTFTNDSKKRSDDFQQLLKTKDDELKKFNEQQKQNLDRLSQELDKKNEAHLHRLQAREVEVDRIFGAIGSASFSGHFKTTADTEHSAANQLRWIALTLMGAMITVAGAAFYHSLRHDITAHIFAFRLATSVVILIPAAYAAQESGKHRDRENALRKMHLELASIDAYLVLLPEAQRHEIKARLTEKFFGREDSKDKQEDSVSKHALFEVLSSVVKNLTKAK